MATDERNFRSTYYEKVGFKGVEEKKSLEILLKEKPFDKVKLKQFCLRFTVPGVYRNLLWKVLLGVLPYFADSHAFAISQRQQQYNDIKRALTIMRIIDDLQTPKAQVFFAMWSLENTTLNFEAKARQELRFITITQTLMEIFDDDVDIYWLAKGFHDIAAKFQHDIPLSIEKTFGLLEKEDTELYKHLEQLDATKTLPLSTWFECCFAGVINEASLAKVWDKLCAGSFKILVFVAFILLTTLRRALLRCSNMVAIRVCIENITEETSEVIVNKAIEVWQQNGCLLTLQPDGFSNIKIKTT